MITKCPINKFIECREDCAWREQTTGFCSFQILAISTEWIGSMMRDTISQTPFGNVINIKEN